MQGEVHSFMRKRRLFVVAFIVGAVSLGIPSQVSAAPSIPRSLTAVRTVLSQVGAGESSTLSVRMPWRANMVGVSYVDSTHSQKGFGEQHQNRVRIYDGGQHQPVSVERVAGHGDFPTGQTAGPALERM